MIGFRQDGFAFRYLTVGRFEVEASQVFATAPEADREAALERHDLPTMLVFLVRSLVVDTPANRVLIDPSGDWETSDGLETALGRAQIDPASVDTVIVSHGHADHFKGGVGSGGRPLFENARYWMQRSEWEHWLSAGNPEPDHVANFREIILPIEDRFSFAEGEQEVVPGIRCLPAPGHSPGHQVVDIGGLAMYTGDILLSPPNVEHPEWCGGFDVWPEQVAATRQRLVRELAESGTLVITCHFPGSGAGRIVPGEGESFRWQPESFPDATPAL